MSALRYLYGRTLVNRIKYALRKPITYFYFVFFAFYALMLPYSFRVILSQNQMDSPDGMAAALTALSFLLVPGNLIAYAKRKGLLYRNSDVHFLFPSPISPKKVLLYAHLKTLIKQFLMNLFVALLGAFLFYVVWWRVALYFLFSLVIENILEGSIMMVLYGTERLSERGRQNIVTFSYLLVGAVLVLAGAAYVKHGLSVQSVMGFLHSDALQLIPVIGWYIAVIHLLFMGASTVSIIGTIAYAVLLGIVICIALRMKCTGAYYEDAMKFADDYDELIATRKQGRTDKKFGQKEKFGKASVTYKGNGAKALFYRQLLEYKKNKFFILDVGTVAALIAGVVIAYLYVTQEDMGILKEFMIPGASAYLIFIFTSLTGKWSRELNSPYTYLIPDSPFKKLWYATAMQHVSALINGILITVPGAIVMKQSLFTSVLCVAFYVILSANKLYALAVAEAVVGNVMGRIGKSFFQLFIQGIVIGVAFIGAFVGMLVGGINLAYLLMILFMGAATFLFMLAATLNFYKLEPM